MESRGKEIELEEVKDVKDYNLKEENTQLFDFYEIIKNYGAKPYKSCKGQIDSILKKVDQKKTRSSKVRKKKKEKIKQLKKAGEFKPKSEMKKKISKSKQESFAKKEKGKEIIKKKKLNEKIKKSKKEKAAKESGKKVKKIEEKKKPEIKGNKYGMDNMHPSWLAKQNEKETGFVSITKKNNSKVKMIDL